MKLGTGEIVQKAGKHVLHIRYGWWGPIHTLDFLRLALRLNGSSPCPEWGKRKKEKKRIGAREIVQWVELLPCTQQSQAQSSIPQMVSNLC